MKKTSNYETKRVWTYEDMLRDAYLVIPPCEGKDFGECPSICPYLYECHPIDDYPDDPWDDYIPEENM